ncbi:DivIVA domain-containing protein [Staphylospora marina]|uniref:DivIVA domain-containing protein n=1 Tax=Staphylospora marina TaxID=2490858 RepID=UPI000F5BF2CA|nr:DivIVA domain-containing protein [Staphylospora marina]
MSLTPYDIHNKEFKRSFRGYDVDEVNEFLDQIIKEFEILTREKLELEQQVEELQAEIERLMEGESMFQNQAPQPQQPAPQPMPPAQSTMPPMPQYPEPVQMQPTAAALSSMEQSIHKSIRVAQEVAEEVRLNAKKEAELIVQEAEKNADRIINEALQKARAIHSELLDLKQKATIYRARFRTLVQSHLDILENSDWESLEELESGLEEKGKQIEQMAERGQPAPDMMMEQPAPHAHEFTQEFHQGMEDPAVMDEVAAANYMETPEEEPRRELRRTSRKLKKKAMF